MSSTIGYKRLGAERKIMHHLLWFPPLRKGAERISPYPLSLSNSNIVKLFLRTYIYSPNRSRGSAEQNHTYIPVGRCAHRTIAGSRIGHTGTPKYPRGRKFQKPATWASRALQTIQLSRGFLGWDPKLLLPDLEQQLEPKLHSKHPNPSPSPGPPPIPLSVQWPPSCTITKSFQTPATVA